MSAFGNTDLRRLRRSATRGHTKTMRKLLVDGNSSFVESAGQEDLRGVYTSGLASSNLAFKSQYNQTGRTGSIGAAMDSSFMANASIANHNRPQSSHVCHHIK